MEIFHIPWCEVSPTEAWEIHYENVYLLILMESQHLQNFYASSVARRMKVIDGDGYGYNTIYKKCMYV